MSKSYKIGFYSFLISFGLTLVLAPTAWFALTWGNKPGIFLPAGVKIYSLEGLAVYLFCLVFLVSATTCYLRFK